LVHRAHRLLSDSTLILCMRRNRLAVILNGFDRLRTGNATNFGMKCIGLLDLSRTKNMRAPSSEVARAIHDHNIACWYWPAPEFSLLLAPCL